MAALLVTPGRLGLSVGCLFAIFGPFVSLIPL